MQTICLKIYVTESRRHDGKLLYVKYNVESGVIVRA